MSYRNPQIIVDRSGEIWAKAIANFGGDVASGLDKYAAVKRKANEVTKKRKEANQLVWNKTAQKTYDSINTISKTVKDKTIAEEFIIEAKDMAENGTKNSVVVNGKKYTIGAISAETQINSNMSLDKDTVAAYSQIVSNFQGYKKRMIDRGTNIKAGLDPLANSISGDIGNKFDYQGVGPENTKSQIVANTLLEMKIPGVKATKKYERTSFDKGDSYLDMMRVDAEVDLNSETFKLWKDSGLLSEEDLWIEDGATTGTFSWSRDMDTWGKNGSLITTINPGEQTDEILVSSGFTKENGDITDKGFNTNIIYNNRDVDGGVARRPESHFNPDILRNNIAYSSQLTAAAKGVLAMPLDEQMKYIQGNLDWGTIEQSDWASSKISEKIAFLEEQRFQKDLEKIVSAKNGAMGTRLATSKDVLEYKKEGIPLEKGDTVYFSSGKEVYTKGLSSEAETPETPVNRGKDFYNEVKKNPVGMYQEYFGVEPIFNREKNTITIGKESVSGYDKDNPKLTKDIVYNMNDSTDRNRFYINLLKASERTKGTSALSKEDQKGYEDALRSDTSFRSSKLDKKKKEAKAKAKAKADAEAKAKADALKKEMKEAEVFKVDQKRGNQATKRDQ
jgi:hypothetical protein